mgnify:CR=1 FL=1|jgi:hypothetical protein|tara:strand:- start:629 stop:943 length:315 start_codon:yes stop_codon:yes gene_type:complete
MSMSELTWIVMPLTAVVGVGMMLASSFLVEAQSEPRPATILSCYHEGNVIVSAPSVPDFLLRQQGTLLESRWTNPETNELEILVTTLPCLYRVTRPPEGAIPAN